MFKVSETKVSLDYPTEDSTEDESPAEKNEISTDQLWSSLDDNFSKCLPFIEETVDRWNSRTQLLGNLKQANKKNKDTVFNATIV